MQKNLWTVLFTLTFATQGFCADDQSQAAATVPTAAAPATDEPMTVTYRQTTAADLTENGPVRQFLSERRDPHVLKAACENYTAALQKNLPYVHGWSAFAPDGTCVATVNNRDGRAPKDGARHMMPSPDHVGFPDYHLHWMKGFENDYRYLQEVNGNTFGWQQGYEEAAATLLTQHMDAMFAEEKERVIDAFCTHLFDADQPKSYPLTMAFGWQKGVMQPLIDVLTRAYLLENKEGTDDPIAEIVQGKDNHPVIVMWVTGKAWDQMKRQKAIAQKANPA